MALVISFFVVFWFSGLEVTFRPNEAGRAVEVALLNEEGNPRRARLRSHRVMRST